MSEYIERELALSHPFANGKYDRENADEHFILGHESYKEWLEQLPIADVAPVVHGRWDNASRISRKGFEWFKCSNCGMEWSNLTKFCPKCGAKMDLE